MQRVVCPVCRTGFEANIAKIFNTAGGLQWKKKVNGDFVYDVTGTKE